MKIEAGNEYICNLVIDMGLFGKHDVQTVIDVDSATSFHGYGHLTGKPFSVAGFKLDENSVMVFDNGVIDGNDFAFTVAEGGLSASFKARLEEDGSITGTAEAAGLLRMSIKGAVSSVKPLK